VDRAVKLDETSRARLYQAEGSKWTAAWPPWPFSCPCFMSPRQGSWSGSGSGGPRPTGGPAWERKGHGVRCVRRAGYRLELRRARSEWAAGPAHPPGLVHRHDPPAAGVHGALTGSPLAALAAELSVDELATSLWTTVCITCV